MMFNILVDYYKCTLAFCARSQNPCTHQMRCDAQKLRIKIDYNIKSSSEFRNVRKISYIRNTHTDRFHTDGEEEEARTVLWPVHLFYYEVWAPNSDYSFDPNCKKPLVQIELVIMTMRMHFLQRHHLQNDTVRSGLLFTTVNGSNMKKILVHVVP